MTDLQIQSKTIDYLRFPLAIMVIFIHQNPVLIQDPSTIGEWLFNIIGSAGSHVLSHIAVPLFFFISGYYFFYKKPELTKIQYVIQIKKKFKSLFLPYVYWNLIAFLIFPFLVLGSILLKGRSIDRLWDSLSNFNLNIFWDSTHWSGGWWCFGLFEAPDNTGPADLPLWFLRNLIILILLTPLIYYFIKKFGKFFIIALALFYLSGIWIMYAPLRIDGLFYFSFGAYLSINKETIYTYFSKFKTSVYVISLVMAILCVYFDITDQYRICCTIRPLFVLCGVIAIYIYIYIKIDRGTISYKYTFLGQSSFFIYALHTLLINEYGIKLTHKVVNKFIGSYHMLAEIIGYLLSPIVVGLVCLSIYLLLRRFVPKVLYQLTGNR